MAQKKQIKHLIDNLYYEKLGVIISEISKWRGAKDQFIEGSYIKVSNQLSASIKNHQQYIKQESEVLVDVLAEMKENFSKFKVDPKNCLSKKNSFEKTQEPMFENMKNKWREQKNKLTEIYNFTYTFHAIVVKEITDIEKNCTKLYQTNKKIEHLLANSDARFSNKTHLMSIKNSQKYFELSKTLQISRIYNEEIEEYQYLFKIMQELYETILKQMRTFLKNIVINSADLNKLYGSCFGCQLGSDYIISVGKYKEKIDKKIMEFANSKQLNYKNISDKAIILGKQFEQIIWKAIEQISIASWDIQIKKQESEQQQSHPTKGILTMDNKFIIIENQKTIFGKQFSLVESTILQHEEKRKKKNKSEEEYIEPLVFLKKKKKEETVCVQFENMQRMDQFMLHVKKAKKGNMI